MWVWHKGKISVSTLPRTTVGAHTHTAAMNQMPSHLKRPGTIYFSFSSYCWHTVIAGSRCLATKSGQAFFQSSVREKLRPSPSPEEWLKGHFTPRLVSEQRLSFLKTIKRVCVCVRVCERESGGGHLNVGAKHSVMSGQSSSSTDLVIEVVKGEVTLQDQ